jgi:hypothetical protein
MYTGVGQYNLTRTYKYTLGYDKEFVIFREKYFDGKDTKPLYRNPWKGVIPLNGTDATMFHPQFTREEEPWVYLDDLFHTGKFVYHGDKRYHDKMTAYRFT